MPASFLVVLPALVLSMETCAAAQPHLPDCLASFPRIELAVEPGGEVPRVCMLPGLGALFVFDSPLLSGGLEVQARERFLDVSMGTRSFTVIAPADLQTGERFKVVARFADGAAPGSATFELVGHPSRAARQVMVSRHERTVEDYQQEVKEKDARIQQLETELERMRAQGGGPGITGLIAARVMGLDGKGVVPKNISESVSPFPDNALAHGRTISYRIDTPREEDGEPVVRVAVAVQLHNPGTTPWAPGGTALVVKGQEGKELKPWTPEPIPPGLGWHWVVVETELTEREAQGTYTLELWDESGSRLVSLGHVTFP